MATDSNVFLMGSGKVLVAHGTYGGIPCISFAHSKRQKNPRDHATEEDRASDWITIAFTSGDSAAHLLDTLMAAIENYEQSISEKPND